MAIIAKRLNKWYIFADLTAFSCDALFVVGTVFYTNHLNTKLECIARHAADVLLTTTITGHREFYEELIRTLQTKTLVKQTACNFFELNRQALLSLIGAIITFTVLVIQTSKNSATWG